MQLFDCLKQTVRRKKALFVILLLLTVLTIILAIFAAININNGIFDIDLSNVPYIKFLRGSGGLPVFIFNCFVTIGIIYAVIILTFAKPYTAVIGVIFYLYFVYSQIVIFVSVIMIYGFLNVLLILILILLLLVIEFFVLMLICLELASICNCSGYFKTCFDNSNCKLLLYSLILLAAIFVFCLVTMLLRSFVILLVY